MLVTSQALVLPLIKAANDPTITQLGAAVPDHRFFPIRAIQRAQSNAARNHLADAINCSFPPGLPALRRQITRRMTEFGCAILPNEIVITNGCQEALTLALKAPTNPGDIVAIESPTFYGLLQVLESLGLEVLELPTNPRTGISVDALELALTNWDVKACVVVPNFSNPLGFCMPDENKQQLVDKLASHQIPLIEDDVYGDLGFGGKRPSACKGLAGNRNANHDIYYRGSFSKTLSPGLRVGWIVPPRKQHKKIEYMKYVLNLGTPTTSQMIVADLLSNGSYQRQLRQVCQKYSVAVNRMTQAIVRYFPAETKITRPEGGFVIWLELPVHIDSISLARDALKLGISISPGPIFSASQKYQHYIRISCACVWSAEIEQAIVTLARLIDLPNK